MKLEHILVPTDFSGPSAAALRYARELAKAFNSSLHLLHVVHDPVTEAFGYPRTDFVSAWERNAAVSLRALLPEAEGATFRARWVTRIGRPVDEILRYVEEYEIDLVVMGTHGRGAIGHLLMGNVAERVVRRAGCPVLTIRAGEREATASSPESDKRGAAHPAA